ncbi:hypothetical protein CRI94_14985 [Longibacter salinarum]|uniref:Methyltransferase n=1 Tax=Longibacter salinarum TaxID=1850348 RepID=A0A2A8CV42_9BACT|nr:class I SAM-dependent methyltransferase [Longibacter salinarum]PEN12324.1 hypothetical protein CRI94_14985 [Longibacter salinarum]
MNFKHQDTQITVAYAAILILLSAGVYYLVNAEVAVLATLVAGLTGIVGLVLNVYRSRAKDDIAQNEHIQALLFVYEMLDVEAPLPDLTEWAISPQLAATLIRLVRDKQPEVVLEVGSGSSTVVMSYVMEQLDRGRVISLDHSAEYTEMTRSQIEKHGLSHRVDVIHAPLVDTEIGGEVWPWYDVGDVDLPPIDVLFVDGPPQSTRSLARYPAVPVLRDNLSGNAVIVLDDAYRPDESEIADRWASELETGPPEIEKSPYGTAVLYRTS